VYQTDACGLMRCEWIYKRENITALGSPGVGKTHTALTLGLVACQKRVSVAFTTAAALVRELMEACDEKRLCVLQKQLTNVKLLIIEGYVPFTAAGTELLSEVFNRCYEHASTLVTSNSPFGYKQETAETGSAVRIHKGGYQNNINDVGGYTVLCLQPQEIKNQKRKTRGQIPLLY